jgi:hypothetical protein
MHRYICNKIIQVSVIELASNTVALEVTTFTDGRPRFGEVK